MIRDHSMELAAKASGVPLGSDHTVPTARRHASSHPWPNRTSSGSPWMTCSFGQLVAGSSVTTTDIVRTPSLPTCSGGRRRVRKGRSVTRASRTPPSGKVTLAALPDVDHDLGFGEETDLHELGPGRDELALGDIDIGDPPRIAGGLRELRTLVGDHVELSTQPVLGSGDLPVTRRVGAPLFLSQLDPRAVQIAFGPGPRERGSRRPRHASRPLGQKGPAGSKAAPGVAR